MNKKYPTVFIFYTFILNSLILSTILLPNIKKYLKIFFKPESGEIKLDNMFIFFNIALILNFLVLKLLEKIKNEKYNQKSFFCMIIPFFYFLGIIINDPIVKSFCVNPVIDSWPCFSGFVIVAITIGLIFFVFTIFIVDKFIKSIFNIKKANDLGENKLINSTIQLNNVNNYIDENVVIKLIKKRYFITILILSASLLTPIVRFFNLITIPFIFFIYISPLMGIVYIILLSFFNFFAIFFAIKISLENKIINSVNQNIVLKIKSLFLKGTLIEIFFFLLTELFFYDLEGMSFRTGIFYKIMCSLLLLAVNLFLIWLFEEEVYKSIKKYVSNKNILI